MYIKTSVLFFDAEGLQSSWFGKHTHALCNLMAHCINSGHCRFFFQTVTSQCHLGAPSSKGAGCSFKKCNSSLHGILANTHNQLFGLVRAGLINHCDTLRDESIP